MKVFTRRAEERVICTTRLGERIEIKVTRIRGSRVSLCFDADRRTSIRRGELPFQIVPSGMDEINRAETIGLVRHYAAAAVKAFDDCNGEVTDDGLAFVASCERRARELAAMVGVDADAILSEALAAG